MTSGIPAGPADQSLSAAKPVEQARADHLVEGEVELLAGGPRWRRRTRSRRSGHCRPARPASGHRDRSGSRRPPRSRATGPIRMAGQRRRPSSPVDPGPGRGLRLRSSSNHRLGPGPPSRVLRPYFAHRNRALGTEGHGHDDHDRAGRSPTRARRGHSHGRRETDDSARTTPGQPSAIPMTGWTSRRFPVDPWKTAPGPKGEHPAVGGDQVVAGAVGGGGHADDGLVQVDGPRRPVERSIELKIPPSEATSQ